MKFLELFENIIGRWAKQHDGRQTPYLVRLQKAVSPDKSVLNRLLAFSTPEKFYFRAKDDDFILAGLGSALVIEGKSAADILNGMERLWKDDETVPVFGGFSFFPDDEAAAEWLPFGRFRFVLPFVEFQESDGNLLIIVNYINKKGHSPQTVARELGRMLEALDAESRDRPGYFIAADSENRADSRKSPVESNGQKSPPGDQGGGYEKNRSGPEKNYSSPVMSGIRDRLSGQLRTSTKNLLPFSSRLTVILHFSAALPNGSFA